MSTAQWYDVIALSPYLLLAPIALYLLFGKKRP